MGPSSIFRPITKTFDRIDRQKLARLRHALHGFSRGRLASHVLTHVCHEVGDPNSNYDADPDRVIFLDHEHQRSD